MRLKFTNKNIPYNRQYIDKEDKTNVLKSLKEDLITTGRFVKRLESKIKNKVKAKFVNTCINGTAGLHLAFEAINLKKNDAVIMPAVNFIAAYRNARMLGAKIYLADVDEATGQMTPETVMECVKKNKLKKIKLILNMYLGGYPFNNYEFFKLKKRYKCFLIEDACHAFGSKYKYLNKYIPIGSCKHSDLCVFSFHPVKPITTGEGGAITTNSKKFADKIRLAKSHGIIRSKKYWSYDIKNLGYNFRLSDINCALGLSQLKKIKTFHTKRKKIFNLYKKKLSCLSEFIRFTLPKNSINSFHLVIASINFSKLNLTKDRLITILNKKKIFPQFHYIPIYNFSFFKKRNKEKFPGSENYYKKCLSLPIYHDLKMSEQQYIIKNLINIIQNNKF